MNQKKFSQIVPGDILFVNDTAEGTLIEAKIETIVYQFTFNTVWHRNWMFNLKLATGELMTVSQAGDTLSGRVYYSEECAVLNFPVFMSYLDMEECIGLSGLQKSMTSDTLYSLWARTRYLTPREFPVTSVFYESNSGKWAVGGRDFKREYTDVLLRNGYYLNRDCFDMEAPRVIRFDNGKSQPREMTVAALTDYLNNMEYGWQRVWLTVDREGLGKRFLGSVSKADGCILRILSLPASGGVSVTTSGKFMPDDVTAFIKEQAGVDTLENVYVSGNALPDNEEPPKTEGDDNQTI